MSAFNGIRFKWSGLTEDRTLEVDLYTITDFKTRTSAYEGHYQHYDIRAEASTRNWTYRKGDYLIKTDQIANRYLIETLEPMAPDSYFAWNFFDGILMQKEYFSPYVFEDLAAAFLEENPAVKEALEAQKAEDTEFAKSSWAQLMFVYQRSPWYEPTHNVYPVGRLMKAW